MSLYTDFADSKWFYSFPDTEVLFENENGFLLYGKDDGLANCYAADEVTAKAIVKLIPKNVTLVSVRGDFIKNVLLNCGFVIQDDCFQFEYYGKPLNSPKSEFTIRKIGINDFDKIAAFYHSSVEYIKNLLKKGVFLAAFKDDEIIGAIGEHERGTIGMLFVKPTYRRKGIATLLMTAKTNEVLSKNKVPVLHVKKGNDASFYLQKNIGYELVTDKSYWLKPKDFYEKI